jgi:hypothetical protein
MIHITQARTHILGAFGNQDRRRLAKRAPGPAPRRAEDDVEGVHRDEIA